MKNTHLRAYNRHEMDPHEWDELARSSDDAWFWHLSDAIKGYTTWEGYQDLSFAVRNSARDNVVIAIIPLHRARSPIPGFSRLESTGGPAIFNELQAKERKIVENFIYKTLKKLACSHRATRVDLSLSPLSPAVLNAKWPMINPFVANGLQETSTMSWVVPMGDYDENGLWKNVAHRTRKAVNKAIKNGYEMREAHEADLDLYMRLHKDTSTRNSLPEKPRSYAENIFNKLIPHNKARVFIAEKDDEPVAFHSFAIFKHAAIYWTTGCTADALRDGVNNFLLWEAMRSLKADGIAWLECGEALPHSQINKLQRINDFKRSFGGKLYPYYRGSLISSPFLEATLDVLRVFKS